MIVDRNKAYNRWKTFKTQDLHSIFREHKLKVNKEIKLAKTKFFKDKFNGAIGSKKTWKAYRTRT